jgi:allantoinase
MIVWSRRVVLPDGTVPAAISIHDGTIAGVERTVTAPDGEGVLNVGELVVMPGLVDTHVHINEPGRTDWEGFATATRAAAAGGVTTLVDMPLNSVPATTTVAALEEKRRAAAARCFVDVAFWGGVVPGNEHDLEPLAEAGVRGFKCFLSPSGVDEFLHVDELDLQIALPILARLDRPLLAHAELPLALTLPHGDPTRYRTWLDSRPAEAEVAAIDLLLRLTKQTGTRLHIVHLATADALPLLREAKRLQAVTVETCPHYLTFAAEDVADRDTLLKCAPPIREARERDRLWAGLIDGEIDLIATDHSPAPPSLKQLASGDFIDAWGGIASLQLGLSVVWTGAHARDVDLGLVARWLAEAPARLAGLQGIKGVIAAGADADLVIWDPAGDVLVDARHLYHRHKLTPYDGRRLRGRVHMTILRGNVIYRDGQCEDIPSGQLI